MSEAAAILEPAATRIRDPLTGRSLWMAGMIAEPHLEGDVLHFSLVLQPTHSAEDQTRLEAALTSQITQLGFDGDIQCKVQRRAPAQQVVGRRHRSEHCGQRARRRVEERWPAAANQVD